MSLPAVNKSILPSLRTRVSAKYRRIMGEEPLRKIGPILTIHVGFFLQSLSNGEQVGAREVQRRNDRIDTARVARFCQRRK